MDKLSDISTAGPTAQIAPHSCQCSTCGRRLDTSHLPRTSDQNIRMRFDFWKPNYQITLTPDGVEIIARSGYSYVPKTSLPSSISDRYDELRSSDSGRDYLLRKIRSWHVMLVRRDGSSISSPRRRALVASPKGKVWDGPVVELED